MNKQHILHEIERTAKANGGVPLGRQRFFSETGIKESDWFGKYWARWSDAIIEAGFTPNQKNVAYDETWLIRSLVALARELGRFPVVGDLRMKARNDKCFPSHNVFNRFGSKAELVTKVADFCRVQGGFDDVLTMCEGATKPEQQTPLEDSEAEVEVGCVYLLKSGRFYKIGRSNSCGRRERELAIQLPERAQLVHEIRTDDPVGIEAYWHRRFEAQRKNGEWFALSSSDIKAFKRRKFM